MAERLPLTVLAHRAVAEVAGPGAIVIDATAGNGHDTCFLAGLVGPAGQVYAFDIQPAAIDAARQRLETRGLATRVTLIHAGHQEMTDRLPASTQGRVAACMFNLGYLPGSDKRLATRPQTTLQALQLAVARLMPGGVLTIIAYPGHPGGADESAAVRHRLEADPRLVTSIREGAEGSRPSPVLFVSHRIPDERTVAEQSRLTRN